MTLERIGRFAFASALGLAEPVDILDGDDALPLDEQEILRNLAMGVRAGALRGEILIRQLLCRPFDKAQFLQALQAGVRCPDIVARNSPAMKSMTIDRVNSTGKAKPGRIRITALYVRIRRTRLRFI